MGDGMGNKSFLLGFSIGDIMKKMIILGLILLVAIPFLVAQEAQNVTNEAQEIAVKLPEKPMAWQLPIHMRESLQVFLNQKVEEYKAFLIENVKGFESMPDNVVFDFASGLFITPEGIAKLQEQQKQEVKKDEVKK